MLAETGIDIAKAASWLMSGDVVGIPTETVYGLAANALNEQAVLKVYHVKERPAFDPLIVHVAGPEYVNQIAETSQESVRLMELFWPGPLTILLPKKKIVPDLVTSGLNTVAVRMPAHPLALELLKSLPFPLAAPSANPFGYISPTTATHVQQQLGEKIPYILDGGPCSVGVESTIISVNGREILLHRKGGIPVERLEQAGFNVKINEGSHPVPSAPGMLDSHYAPHKPLYFGKARELLDKPLDGPVAVICMDSTAIHNLPENYVVFALSEKKDMDEAARKLFSIMRDLDESDFGIILALEFPENGLGRAINDRLRRASIKRQN